MNVIKSMKDRISDKKQTQYRLLRERFNDDLVSFASGVAIGMIEDEIEWLENMIKEMENENGTSDSVHE